METSSVRAYVMAQFLPPACYSLRQHAYISTSRCVTVRLHGGGFSRGNSFVLRGSRQILRNWRTLACFLAVAGQCPKLLDDMHASIFTEETNCQEWWAVMLLAIPESIQGGLNASLPSNGDAVASAFTVFTDTSVNSQPRQERRGDMQFYF